MSLLLTLSPLSLVAADPEAATLLQNPYRRKAATRKSLLRAIVRSLHNVKDVPFIFFAKHDDLYIINKAVLYVQKNEQTSKLIIVHCASDARNTKSMSEVRVCESDLRRTRVPYWKYGIHQDTV